MVKKKSNNFFRCILLFALIILFPVFVTAQNLCPNPGFEIGCPLPPDGNGQISAAFPWENPGTTHYNHPDLFSSCFDNSLASAFCEKVGVPSNLAGGNVYARTGNNYAGIVCYRSNNLLRDYITVPLPSPLTPGKAYKISCYARRAPYSRHAVANIGFLLSSGKPVQVSNGLILKAAQIENKTLISDTSNWTLISGYFLASVNVDYLTIGNFQYDSLTLKADYGLLPNSACLDRRAYYFIDDVSIEEFLEQLVITGDTIVCPGLLTTLTAVTNSPFWWSTASNPNDTLSTLVSITVDPALQSTYILNGIVKKSSVSIQIIAPPVVNLGLDTSFCEGETFPLCAYNPNSTYAWSTLETTDTIYVNATGTYWVRVNNGGCIRTDTIDITAKYNPTTDLGTDSIFCLNNYDSLLLDAGLAASYYWQPTGETSRYKSVYQNGNYNVLITQANGCTSSDGITAKEICPPRIFIPKAFSPNGDLLNDYFQPFATNIISYQMKIFNRWGQQVFYGNNKSWNGSFQNSEAASGIYVYHITYTIKNETGTAVTEKINGWVALIE